MNYFDDVKNIKALSEIIDSWKGTPYKHLESIKGRGVDCTLFIGNCLKELGILSEVKYDYCPSDWYVHSHDQFLVDKFHEHWDNYLLPELECVEYPYEKNFELVYGDILIFTMMPKSPVKNHASIFTGCNKMVQSTQGRNVGEIQLGNFFKKRLTDIFRIEVIEWL